jgi:hypothetical protein
MGSAGERHLSHHLAITTESLPLVESPIENRRETEMVDLEARVAALETALVGLAATLGENKQPIIDHLNFVAVETAAGQPEAPPIAKAAIALAKKLQ